jgi:hypothetical protein
MPMLYLQRCLLASLIAFIAATSRTLADSPAPPMSYKEISPNGKFVFEMIAPLPLDDEVRPWNDETRAGIRAIRSLYSTSGLYRNDGSIDPLWTVDWYAHGVEVASDGVHLVRHGPWASSTDHEALSFFASGELLRTYRIRQLVDFPIVLPHSVSHFRWSEEMQLHDSKLQYSVATKDGNRFNFDMRTGEIVSTIRPGRWLVGGVLLIIGLGWIVLRNRRRALARRGGVNDQLQQTGPT